MKYLLDANILLRVRHSVSPHREACAKLLDRHRKPSCDAVLCTQTLIEYWVVATRPVSVNGLGLNAFQARGDIDNFLGVLPCLLEPPDVLDRWKALVARFSVSGRPAHDARFVAVMDAYGLTDLISLNVADFQRYPHIRCLTPQQWLAANPESP